MDYGDFEGITIAFLLDSEASAIRQRLKDAENIRRKLVIKDSIPGQPVSNEDAWNFGKTWLACLEDEISTVLKKHSIRFWFHIYCRIKTQYTSQDGIETRWNTVGLVRQITELAICKHGSMHVPWEMGLTTERNASEFYGGYTESALRSKAGKDAEVVFENFSRDISSVPLWVITIFNATDICDLFFVEGACYEYWRVTSMMRSVGKGRTLTFDAEGGWNYTLNSDIERLIKIYDKRISNGAPFTTLAGVWLGSKSPQLGPQNSLLIPSYNFRQEPTGSVLNALGCDVPDIYISNFTLHRLNLHNFVRKHKFLTEKFIEVYGYSLETFASTLGVLALIALYPEGPVDGASASAMAHQQASVSLLSVGYAKMNMPLETLVNVIEGLSRSAFGAAYWVEKKEVLKMLSDLALSEQMRARMSLWSGGPLPMLIPEPTSFLALVNNLPELLEKKFVGVRHKTSGHGTVFEEEFRVFLNSHNYVVEHKTIRIQKQLKREIDAAVKIDSKLYVFECFSMERPLDFEIGQARTIRERNSQLEKKINQVQSLVAHLQATPKGKNYDFSDITEFLPYVVTPFIEWIWSADEKFWDGRGNPRIVSPEETLCLLRGNQIYNLA